MGTYARNTFTYACAPFTLLNFSIFLFFEILREINLRECRSTENAILRILGALNFDYDEFLQSPNVKDDTFLTSPISKIDFT